MLYDPNENGLEWINPIDEYHFLIHGNRIESLKKYIKLIRILFFEMLKMNMRKKKINFFSECECRCKINYIRLCDLLNNLFISLNPLQ